MRQDPCQEGSLFFSACLVMAAFLVPGVAVTAEIPGEADNLASEKTSLLPDPLFPRGFTCSLEAGRGEARIWEETPGTFLCRDPHPQKVAGIYRADYHGPAGRAGIYYLPRSRCYKIVIADRERIVRMSVAVGVPLQGEVAVTGTLEVAGEQGTYALLDGTVTALAVPEPVSAAKEIRPQAGQAQTLLEYYENLVPASLDSGVRARRIADKVLDDFRNIQNYFHNPYRDMLAEWTKMGEGRHFLRKTFLTALYALIDRDADPAHLVKVMISIPEYTKKYLVVETLGKLNPPKKNTKGGLLIDIHTHQGEMGMSYDSVSPLECSLVKAVEKGLDGVVITNHDVVVPDLEPRVEILKNAGKIPRDFLVIPGMEYTSPDGYHLLMMGIRENLAPGMSMKEAVRTAQAKGALVVFAHPNRMESMLAQNPVVDGIVIDNLDLVDVARQIAANGKKLPVFACSDAHYPSLGGVNATRIFTEERTEKGVFAAIRKGEVEPVYHPLLDKLMDCVPRLGILYAIARAKIKAETAVSRALGADYVVFGENSLVPSRDSATAGFGKFAVSYTRRNGENLVKVKAGIAF